MTLRLQPGVHHPQGQALRRGHQRQVGVQAVLCLVTEAAQPGDAGLASEIQFGGVLDAQDHRMPLRPVFAFPGMAGQQFHRVYGAV